MATEAELQQAIDLLLAHWQAPRERSGSLPTLAERLGRLLPAEVRQAPAEHREEIAAGLAQLLATDLVAAGLMRRALAVAAAAAPTGAGVPPAAVQANGNLGLINTGTMSGVTFTGPTVAAPAPSFGRAAERERICILFLAANPESLMQLRLDQEMRGIDLALQKGECRDRFELVAHWAVRPGDLQTCLLRHRPHIVHWSGHGQTEGICLEAADGSSHSVSGGLLARLFAVSAKELRCVVLNACYSATQADAIAQTVDCVIGMSTAVGDQAAARFAAAFYQALAFGCDVRAAWELGQLEIGLAGLGEEEAPRLIATRCDPASVVFARAG